LDAEHRKIIDKLKTALSEVPNLTITMDIWSDKKMRGFLGLTAHYIQNKILKSSTLAVDRFQGESFDFQAFCVNIKTMLLLCLQAMMSY
jgi:hypothetical protein